MNIVNSTTLAFPDLLQKTLRCSRYAKRTLDTDPQLLEWLQENFTAPCNGQEMQELLQQSGLDLDDETGLACAMRRLRKQVMVKLILRDLNGMAGLDEVMQSMTTLAELCVQRAYACLTQRNARAVRGSNRPCRRCNAGFAGHRDGQTRRR